METQEAPRCHREALPRIRPPAPRVPARAAHRQHRAVPEKAAGVVVNAHDAVKPWSEIYPTAWRTGELSRPKQSFPPDGRTLPAAVRVSGSAVQSPRRTTA